VQIEGRDETTRATSICMIMLASPQRPGGRTVHE